MEFYLLALGYGGRDLRDKWKSDWSSTRVFLGVLGFRKFKTLLIESKCGLIVRNLSISIDYRFKFTDRFLIEVGILKTELYFVVSLIEVKLRK
jgi:hypothetical protein